MSGYGVERAQSWVSWNGGTPTWHAQGVFVKYGPAIAKVCATKTGARFGAWRRGRR